MDTQELQAIKARYDIIGNNAELNKALEIALVAATADIDVLITGESGVGKDVIARLIHENSRRKSNRFVAVNCGALPAGTVNAELFGHEKGAFTGAIATRKGFFEEADGGTLFLDEIGELPMETQAMLLRALQNKEFTKVGSSTPEKFDVRIITATNKNLWHEVSVGKFRSDLMYRFNALQIRMPALRDRKEDIYMLFRKFSVDFATKNRLCKVQLTHDAVATLSNYRWPGNVRQLKNVAESVTLLCSQPKTASMEVITLDTAAISAFIPNEEDSLLPATVDINSKNPGQTVDNASLQAIVKAIFDLKGEVDRLRSIVEASPAASIAPSGIAPANVSRPADVAEEADWQDATPVPEITSLKDNKNELYRRALEKHNGNAKAAAKELGVSERTIYRWLDKKNKKNEI